MSWLSYLGILFQAKINKKFQHIQLADPSKPAPMRSFSELYLTEMSDGVNMFIDNRMAKDKQNLLRVIKRLIKQNKQLMIIEMVKTFDEKDIRYIYEMDNTVKLFTRYIDAEGYLGVNQILEIDIESYMIILDKLDYFKKRCLEQCSTDLDKVIYTIANLANYIKYANTYNTTLSCLTNGLILRYGVCVDMAITLWKCLDTLGIESVFVKGVSNSRFSNPLTFANHAWNQIKIDNNWYNVDLTWLITDKDENFILADDKFFYNFNSINYPESIKRKISTDSQTIYELHKTRSPKHECPTSIDRNYLHNKLTQYQSSSNPFKDYDMGKK